MVSINWMHDLTFSSKQLLFPAAAEDLFTHKTEKKKNNTLRIWSQIKPCGLLPSISTAEGEDKPTIAISSFRLHSLIFASPPPKKKKQGAHYFQRSRLPQRITQKPNTGSCVRSTKLYCMWERIGSELREGKGRPMINYPLLLRGRETRNELHTTRAIPKKSNTLGPILGTKRSSGGGGGHTIRKKSLHMQQRPFSFKLSFVMQNRVSFFRPPSFGRA